MLKFVANGSHKEHDCVFDKRSITWAIARNLLSFSRNQKVKQEKAGLMKAKAVKVQEISAEVKKQKLRKFKIITEKRIHCVELLLPLQYVRGRAPEGVMGTLTVKL